MYYIEYAEAVQAYRHCGCSVRRSFDEEVKGTSRQAPGGAENNQKYQKYQKYPDKARKARESLARPDFQWR